MAAARDVAFLKALANDRRLLTCADDPTPDELLPSSLAIPMCLGSRRLARALLVVDVGCHQRQRLMLRRVQLRMACNKAAWWLRLPCGGAGRRPTTPPTLMLQGLQLNLPSGVLPFGSHGGDLR